MPVISREALGSRAVGLPGVHPTEVARKGLKRSRKRGRGRPFFVAAKKPTKSTDGVQELPEDRAHVETCCLRRNSLRTELMWKRLVVYVETAGDYVETLDERLPMWKRLVFYVEAL